MSVVDQILRIKNAKAAIKQSISDKGIAVSDSALLDEYPALIDSIETGNPYYEELYNNRTNNGTNMAGLFSYYNGKFANVGYDLDTSKAINMSYMFSYSYSVSVLMLGNFDTRNVTDMSYMFENCWSLQYLDLSNFDMTNVTNTNGMFHMCTTLSMILLDNCDHDTISKIINSSSFPTDDIGERRRISVRRTEAYGLTPPENWEFTYVQEQVSYSEEAESLMPTNEDVIQEVIEEQEQMLIDEEKTVYDSDNENLIM